ncbi:DUF262 domain-containing protein [Lysinibacillus fusiformis]|uniref:DUF262 domain-containing protein n=1 Tax=Lysinibacillus fusiformis TaxID=28031 RepID=UPI000882E7B6|nr:DUF262 domain-containing protein [Lysinibacillus fusiformis]SCX66924.1 Protein of unknown function DUF262 [Lysinibacillus fusiformis]SDB41162.1 Protein of unknown function DUF262 [Lysinibacillus fusiformis]SFI55309.1 Protein of unknown function DUF262 [Lysinibacillus fusiformis]SFT23994.1 Protein of unknown function DUF262 [Lysinibacillus fusiformis]
MDYNLENRLSRRNLDISFNELYDMYKDGELVIQPEFQRLFRWSETQQSLFIESLLLDMPIPPIYVDEQEDGTYILVDGLQRISSYLNFRGIELGASEEANDSDGDTEIVTDDEEDYEQNWLDTTVNPGFTLQGCEIRADLNGKSYDDLNILERRNLKRVFIRVEVLTKENEKAIKYHMFKRLNSGGAMLSQQELRNSNIRMVDSKFINFINSLAQNNEYQNLTKYMLKADLKKMKRSENVLRYFLFKNKFLEESYARDSFKLDEDLTLYLEEVTVGKVSFDYELERAKFNKLVEYLDRNFGADIFGGIISRSNNTSKKFVQYNFDGFMLYFSEEENQKEDITLDDIINIKKSEDYLNHRTGGIENVKSRVESIRRQLGE